MQMVIKMYKINAEEARQIREKMKEIKKVGAYRRLQAVALRGEGKKNKEIAKITGYNADWVGQLSKIYSIGGIESLVEDGRKGGNHRNMSESEEEQFLSRFKSAAEKGELTNINDIATAYDEATGKEHESKSTVYYLLHKHGWRELVPQRVHPGKASEDVIEASKKT
jgi:transposase